MAWALSVEIDDFAKFGQLAYSNEIGNNNDNKQICIAPRGRNIRGADELHHFVISIKDFRYIVWQAK